MNWIPYVNLSAQWHDEREDLLLVVEKVLASGYYVGGTEVEEFEQEAALSFRVKHVVALNSGTDALIFGLAAVGVGLDDEVITPPNSFVASTAAIVQLGARPIFVDVGPDQNIDPALIETAITPRTKAIMPVHLTGRMSNMKVINEVARRYGVSVVEDAAQAAGSFLDGRTSGAWGKVGCFSAHPLKNLNACGDAGFITTNDSTVAQKVSLMRNHGLISRDNVERFGQVSRMDAIQAAILRYRLLRLKDVVKRRRANASLYRSMLNSDVVFHPPDGPGEFNTWHTFVIQVDRRDELRTFLTSRKIETAIHYPVPIHLQPAAQNLGYQKGDFPVAERQAGRIITLPIHQYLEENQIKMIAAAINEFCGF